MLYSELPLAERDRLRAAYEAGFCTGACAPWLLGDDPELLNLVDAIADDWFRGLETRQATHRPQWPIDGFAPAWLLAECERQTAIGDARPPERWLGKP